MTTKTINKKSQSLRFYEDKYLHIPKPSWIGIGRFFLTIFLGFLSYFNLKLILDIWEKYNLGYVFVNNQELINYAPKFADLIVLYPLIGEFLLISLTIICLASLFTKLKNYSEKGLITGLIAGLIFGLITGLITGLIIGLIFGLIFGLITGLIEEFK